MYLASDWRFLIAASLGLLLPLFPLGFGGEQKGKGPFDPNIDDVRFGFVIFQLALGRGESSLDI